MHFEKRGHRNAYNSFSLWLGRDATGPDISPENVLAFTKSAIFLALAKSTRKTLWYSLRVMARKHGHAFPGDRLVVPITHEVDGQMTLWGMFEQHYRPRRLIGKSPDTLRLYRTTNNKFSSYLGRPAMLTDLTDEVVSRYLDSLVGKNAGQSIAKEYCQLLALWRFAARRKLIDSYPDIMCPTAPNPIPDAFTPEELGRLISTARAWEGDYFDVPCGIFWEALIRIIYDTGERVGAILKMKPEHLQGDWVLIPATSRKGGQAGKRFKVSETTRDMLAKIAALQAEECLFAWPYCYTYFWTKFGEVLDKAGLPAGRRGKFHKLRRTVATFYEAKGGDATSLLGHSRRQVTEKYLDTRFIEKPQPCDLIDPI